MVRSYRLLVRSIQLASDSGFVVYLTSGAIVLYIMSTKIGLCVPVKEVNMEASFLWM